MTEETLREIEIHSNREDIPVLTHYIRHLLNIISQCRESAK